MAFRFHMYSFCDIQHSVTFWGEPEPILWGWLSDCLVTEGFDGKFGVDGDDVDVATLQNPPLKAAAFGIGKLLHHRHVQSLCWIMKSVNMLVDPQTCHWKAYEYDEKQWVKWLWIPSASSSNVVPQNAIEEHLLKKDR